MKITLDHTITVLSIAAIVVALAVCSIVLVIALEDL